MSRGVIRSLRYATVVALTLYPPPPPPIKAARLIGISKRVFTKISTSPEERCFDRYDLS